MLSARVQLLIFEAERFSFFAILKKRKSFNNRTHVIKWNILNKKTARKIIFGQLFKSIRLNYFLIISLYDLFLG